MDYENTSNPETLTDSKLRDILRWFCVSVPDDMARCNMIELFNKVAVPLPQREVKSKNNLCLINKSNDLLHQRFQNSTSNNNNKRGQVCDISDIVSDTKNMKLSQTHSPEEESDNQMRFHLQSNSPEYVDDDSFVGLTRNMNNNSNFRNFRKRASSELPYSSFKKRWLSKISY